VRSPTLELTVQNKQDCPEDSGHWELFKEAIGLALLATRSPSSSLGWKHPGNLSQMLVICFALLVMRSALLCLLRDRSLESNQLGDSNQLGR
jgi:hypothetical protein